METFVLRVWVPAPDQKGMGPGTGTLHGLVQHVGTGPAVPFRGAEHLLSLVQSALTAPRGDGAAPAAPAAGAPSTDLTRADETASPPTEGGSPS